MHPRTLGLLAVIVFILGGSGAYLVKWLKQQQQHAGTVYLNALPDFRFKDPWGKAHSNVEWAGNIVVLNFWATWCAPCKQEMPGFQALQDRYFNAGVRFVGVAIDTPVAVAVFGQDMDIDFPLLVAEMDGAELSRRLGNRLRALPFTAVFDKVGRLVATREGTWPRDDLEKLISGLLKKG